MVHHVPQECRAQMEPVIRASVAQTMPTSTAAAERMSHFRRRVFSHSMPEIQDRKKLAKHHHATGRWK